jgi:hypothetical protein
MSRDSVLTSFLVVIGVILLLPGVCSLAFIVASGFRIGPDASFMITIWTICFLISAGGILAIYKAFH